MVTEIQIREIEGFCERKALQREYCILKKGKLFNEFMGLSKELKPETIWFSVVSSKGNRIYLIVIQIEYFGLFTVKEIKYKKCKFKTIREQQHLDEYGIEIYNSEIYLRVKKNNDNGIMIL